MVSCKSEIIIIMKDRVSQRFERSCVRVEMMMQIIG